MPIEYGDEIRAARHARGWSTTELANRAHITPDAVAALEDGQILPELPAILAALDLVELHVLTTMQRANFMRLVDPVIAKIDPAHLPIVMAAVLDVIARAAAGITPPPQVGQFNLVQGVVDIENNVG